MGSKRKYSTTVVPDEEVEDFSQSLCTCKDCTMMHVSQLEWDTFIPETHLQKRMMATIKEIEDRIKSGWKSNMKEIPKRLKSDK